MDIYETARLRQLLTHLMHEQRRSEREAQSCKNLGLCVMQDHHEGRAEGLEFAVRQLRELLEELELSE